MKDWLFVFLAAAVSILFSMGIVFLGTATVLALLSLFSSQPFMTVVILVLIVVLACFVYPSVKDVLR